jgi:anti-sigma factor RsiW
MTHIADNHDALLDYLYEEGDPAERLMVAQHLQECAACSVAVLEFQNVRGMLGDWKSPAAELGFRIVQDSGQSSTASLEQRARGAWWQGSGATYRLKPWVRGFVQTAAAALLFTAGMAVSQLNIDYSNGAVTVAWGPDRPSENGRSASITLSPENVNAPANAPSREEIERENRVRPGAGASEADTERLFQRVRAMIDQSEQRQQREFALRLSQFSSEVDTQHQADVLRIQQDVGQQQEALEYLVRTSGGVK